MQLCSWGKSRATPFSHFFAGERVPHFLILPFSFSSNYDGIVVFKIVSQVWAHIFICSMTDSLSVTVGLCNYFTKIYVSVKITPFFSIYNDSLIVFFYESLKIKAQNKPELQQRFFYYAPYAGFRSIQFFLEVSPFIFWTCSPCY